VTLHEGKNRQIHRIGEAVGNPVFRLARVSFAGVNHEGLRPGQWRYLSKDELLALKKSYGVPLRVRPAPPLPNADDVRATRASGMGSGKRAAVAPAPRRVAKKVAARTKRSEGPTSLATSPKPASKATRAGTERPSKPARRQRRG
jgi:23S rRNA pseudouridine2605 synthase